MATMQTDVEEVQERGVPLASIPRGTPDRAGNHREEFRVALDEYRGHPYLSLRLWQRGQDGHFRPVAGKGCSVRLAEAEEVATALLEGLRISDSTGAGRPATRQPRDTSRPVVEDRREGPVDRLQAHTSRTSAPWEAEPAEARSASFDETIGGDR